MLNQLTKPKVQYQNQKWELKWNGLSHLKRINLIQRESVSLTSFSCAAKTSFLEQLAYHIESGQDKYWSLCVDENSLWIVEQDWGCPEAGKVLKEEGVPEWPRLAVFLISEANLGRSSQWFPYIATLPKNPTSILQWLVYRSSITWASVACL